MDEQVEVARGICLMSGLFTARDLEEVARVPYSRIQLVLAFWRACGLVERAPGRGTHLPTKTARAMARAWRAGDQQGLKALRKAISNEWYVRSARARLAPGPRLRTALSTRFMQMARVGEEYRLEVEMLIDLMVCVGLLLPAPEGQLRWNGDDEAVAPWTRPTKVRAEPAAPQTRSAPSGAQQEPAGPPPDPAPEQPGAASVPSSSAVPGPRSVTTDLTALLSRPVQLSDLARLSSEDMLALHGHICGLAQTALKLGSRHSSL